MLFLLIALGCMVFAAPSFPVWLWVLLILAVLFGEV